MQKGHHIVVMLFFVTMIYDIWNASAKYERYKSEIIHNIPQGTNARKSGYEYERNRANELRAKGHLDDRNLHARP